ncbi:hypothetical protein RDWZM_001729 [Blomia tropicalis]|uniref:Uncharacterized protein n=1 Tax=Blomia tropicalis TaxID=40697 RepID=A0A9Q0MCH4_BLOTA|nr:hypothetical protein RDWZM_001729 [Blomia tropicalis]
MLYRNILFATAFLFITLVHAQENVYWNPSSNANDDSGFPDIPALPERVNKYSSSTTFTDKSTRKPETKPTTIKPRTKPTTKKPETKPPTIKPKPWRKKIKIVIIKRTTKPGKRRTTKIIIKRRTNKKYKPKQNFFPSFIIPNYHRFNRNNYRRRYRERFRKYYNDYSYNNNVYNYNNYDYSSSKDYSYKDSDYYDY